VAVSVGQDRGDQGSFVPMMTAAGRAVDQLFTGTGDQCHRVGTVLADAGYHSASNLASIRGRTGQMNAGSAS
jgi:hypothetical protein